MHVQKVTAFITKQQTSELLLFRHPLIGIQLPAGTVEANEKIENALIREVKEETGLSISTPGKHLGAWANELSDNERITFKPTSLYKSPALNSEILSTIGRGVTVPLLGSANTFIESSYYVIDGEMKYELNGWIPEEALSAKKERHFFHIQINHSTPTSWHQVADQDLTFELFWTPFAPKPTLVEEQNKWLDFGYSRLIES